KLTVHDAQRGRPRSQKRYRDTKPDQEHHAGSTGPYFTDCSGQERPAAPKIHQGAQQRRYPQGPTGDGIAQQVTKHGRKYDHRDPNNQVDPEQPSKLRYVIIVITVPAVPTMLLMPSMMLVGIVIVVCGMIGMLVLLMALRFRFGHRWRPLTASLTSCIHTPAG